MTTLVLLPGLDGTGEHFGPRVVACASAVEQFMKHDLTPDPPLNVEQALRVSKLTQEDLWEMDRVLLSHATPSWRKVARIVGTAIGELSARIPNVPDIYYAQRVRHLVEVGKLESDGDLRFMGRSEVRLPAGQPPAGAG